jgi:hypothetical protein
MSESTAKAARHIVELMQTSYSETHTVVPVSETDFPHLNLLTYRSFLADMEARGFRHVADLEILEVSRSTTTLLARTMIRSMISEDGCIVSNYYQVKPRICRRMKLLAKGLLNRRFIDAPHNFINGMRTRHCADFETEFDDRSFLTTSNAQAAALISAPPTIETHYFPYGTSSSVLLDAHRRRLDEILHTRSGVKPIALSCASDLLQMQKRQRLQKMAHRASIQWVTQTELQGMSAGNPHLGDEVFAEVQKLLNDTQSSD